MSIRMVGCRACEQISSGDCGMHGPRMILGNVTFSPPVQTIATSADQDIKALQAEVARLTAERDQLKADNEIKDAAVEGAIRRAERAESALAAKGIDWQIGQMNERGHQP